MSAAQLPHDVAVYIGRFQPFHHGHLALLRRTLDTAPLCVVVIGSAFQARTPKNPFTWQERAEMIRLALPEADRARLVFVPVRDYYDEARWLGFVRGKVDALLRERKMPTARVALVGHLKDPTSEYLQGFAGWQFMSVDRVAGYEATSVRDAYFGHAGTDLDATLGALVSQVPESTIGFLRAWAKLPFFASLAVEWEMLKRHNESWAAAPYPPVFVTVDAIVKCNDHVLLIRRGHAPGKGLRAVPGGFIEMRETAYQSALRELREETNLNLLDTAMRHAFRAAVVFDHPDRSLRVRTITHAHFFDLGEREFPEVLAGDDAAAVEWVPIDRLAAMEDQFLDDHFHMLDHFLELTTDD